LALVAGIPTTAEAIIDAPIGRSSHDRTMMSVHGVGAVREARTTYRVLAGVDRASLLLCDLHTGRTHQVRVHLSSIGHPVLGDTTYTSTASERLSDEWEIRSLCLHAWKLRFVSPADQKEHAVESSLPSSFISALQRSSIPWKS
jgi:23S rRNA pseudouridine1911/1915/1917 synthase